MPPLNTEVLYITRILFTIIQCSNVTNITNTEKNLALTLPLSFLQISGKPPFVPACPRIISYNDSAGKDGSFLYGGLLDRSRLLDVPDYLPYDYFTSYCAINVSRQNKDTNIIASQPFQLSPRDDNEFNYFQNGISVYRGQTFRLHIVALGQGKSTVPTAVTALIY